MIGTLQITYKLQPKIGDRDDYLVRAVGPGNTDYSFPLSITRTLLSIWGGNSSDYVEELVRSLFKISGTASPPPEKGFWFDSYNSKDTLKDTKNLIANKGIRPFVKGGIEDRFVNLFGNNLFSIKIEIDNFFETNFNRDFFRSFEDAWEDSQVIDDLNLPAKDHAHFLYRICILSVFIDHIMVRLDDEDSTTLSLRALENWLAGKLDRQEARRLTETFARVKDLRKQYPIHETYKISGDGNRLVRRELQLAKKYFDLDDSYGDDWNKVSIKFNEAMQNIINALSKNNKNN